MDEFIVEDRSDTLVREEDEDETEFQARVAEQKRENLAAIAARMKVLGKWGRACDKWIAKKANAGMSAKPTVVEVGVALLGREFIPNRLRNAPANPSQVLSRFITP